MPDRDEEIRRLQGCIRDMVSLLALPAMWSGREVPEILSVLLESLLSMLRLDFAYARIITQADDVTEATRVAQDSAFTDRIDEIAPLLEQWLSFDPDASTSKFSIPSGNETLHLTRISIGLQEETGVVVAASRRADFPTEIEALLLRVAANQTAIAVQGARLISERKRVEQKLREQTEIVRSINHIGQMLSAELDQQKLVQAVTDAATELCGARFGSFFYNVMDESGGLYMLYTLSGASIKHFSHFPMPRATDLFGPTFRGEGTILIDDVKKDPRYGNNSPYYGLPAGHLPVTSYLAVPVISRSGEVIGGLFFGHPDQAAFQERDARIIEGLAAQTAIAMDNARLYQKAQEASRLKDDFLAVVSHELRTPLNAILGWARMLRTGKLDDVTYDRATETIERNAKAQAQLIDDLLDVSRIITGKLQMDLQPVDLASLIKTVLQSVRPSVEAKGVRLQLTLDSSAGFISGDADRLQQVIWNLLSNAVKFTPKEGSIQVRLERIDSHIEIVVSDTGVGIKPEFLPYVFDRFFQADSSYTRKQGGLGLGLAIVRHLVELHGGTVHAHSAGAGQGSTFTVRLPLMALQDAARFLGEASERMRVSNELQSPFECNSSLSRLRVLVVDDENDARELLTVALKKCKAEVIAVGTVAEAMAALAKSKPDAIVSDIEMPGEDGYSFIRKVRSLEAKNGGRIPAIALTAHARTEDRLRALSSGYQSHVAKPVDPAELVAVIASLVGQGEKSDNA